MLAANLVANYHFSQQNSSEHSSLPTEMNSNIGSLRTEMNSNIGSLRTEMGSLRTEMNSKIDNLGNFIKSRYDGKAYIDTARHYSVYIETKNRADTDGYEGSGHIISLKPNIKKEVER
jgi:hypothetical protein